MAINYPLTATFKLVTLSPEVQVRDANGALLLQVKQKLLSLREDTTVFADEQKTVPLYRMKADRISGFWAVHRITRLQDNAEIGSVRADGWRSIWRARYTVTDANGQALLSIREENPWIKVLDALVDEVPVVGFLIGMFINPAYLVEDQTGRVLYRINKRRSLVERRFTLERVISDHHPDIDERLVALALIQTMMLERANG